MILKIRGFNEQVNQLHSGFWPNSNVMFFFFNQLLEVTKFKVNMFRSRTLDKVFPYVYITNVVTAHRLHNPTKIPSQREFSTIFLEVLLYFTK